MTTRPSEERRPDCRRQRTRRFAMSLVVCCVIPHGAGAQSAAAADSAFARGDWPAAGRGYAAVLARDSSDARARFRLGVALFEQRRFREAIPLFQRTVRASFQVAQAELRLARSYAQVGPADSVMAHLDRAVDAGVRLQQVTALADLAPVRDNPRYRAIVQRLEDVAFPCRRGAAAHQFDFWIGDWVVTPWGAPASVPAIGRNTITAQLEHCLLLEEWTAADGSTGKSFNFWDTNRSVWRQVWTSGDGQSLDYEGQFAENAMRFTGWTLSAKGTRVMQKLTFFRVAPDTVRQLFEASSDSGATWQNTFDGRYVRRTSTGAKP